MAHLQSNAAIFSPSVARAAASAAKDWSYIDRWLQRKFPGRNPPPFERNADTLRALLALASANEAADEEQALIARLEAETLEQLRAHEQSQDHQSDNSSGSDSHSMNIHALDDAREAILTSLESSLTREGQTALNAMASLALQTGISLPTPAALGAELISLSTQSAILEQTISRLDILTAYIAREAAATAKLATDLRPPSPHTHHHDDDDDDDDNDAIPHTPSKRNSYITPTPTTSSQQYHPHPGGGGGYHPPATLALQNLDTQRRIKSLTARLPELRDRAVSLARSVGGVPSPSIEQVRREEEAYLALLAEKKALDAEVRAFEGLPPDTARAREELEALRAELRRLTVRRDEVFEGLVERETPRRERGPGRR